MNIAVDAHGHQGMPILYLDLGDVAYVDVGDTHAGVLLNDNHIGQPRLDGVRAVAGTSSSRQAERIQATPLTARDRGQARGDQRRGEHALHGVPPGSGGKAGGGADSAKGATIRPWSPRPGSVVVDAGGISPANAASAGSGPVGLFTGAGTSGGV